MHHKEFDTNIYKVGKIHIFTLVVHGVRVKNCQKEIPEPQGGGGRGREKGEGERERVFWLFLHSPGAEALEEWFKTYRFI